MRYIVEQKERERERWSISMGAAKIGRDALIGREGNHHVRPSPRPLSTLPAKRKFQNA